MARIQTHPILNQLRVARSCAEQISALRALKNEIVGHAQKKERWVELGVLESVVKILGGRRSSPKLSGRDARSHGSPQRQLSEEEKVRLQALQVLASFATGGPAFLAPLHASGAILDILTNILPTENPPQIVILALRALHSLADAALLAAPPSSASSTVDATTLAELLFAPLYMDPIHGILSATSSQDPPNGQVTLAAELICKLCREEQYQNALANAGVLDALATILASSVVAQGHVVPGAEIIGRDDGLADMIPEPASPTAELAPVLGAISAIVGDSRFRACLLLCSPAIMAIFPSAEFSPPARDSRTAWNAMEMAGFASLRTRSPGAIDYLLPVVPVHPAKAVSSQLSLHFPSLAYSSSRDITYGSSGKRQQVRFSGWDPSKIFDLASSNADAAEIEEPESPLVPWLIHQVGASTDRLESITHAAILTVLWRAGFVSRAREQSLGVLVVPPLVQTLESGIVSEGRLVQGENQREWRVLEQGADVLARLVADSELLQTAAVECGGDKVVAKLLRQSYEPMLGSQPQRMWSPTPGRPSSQDVNGESSPAFNRLGPPGQTPLYAHRLRLRESALKAMAALISLNQDIRKVFVTIHDVMPFVSESLYEMPSRPRSSKERHSSDSKPAENLNGGAEASRYGRNPDAVLISACHIVRLLSRSVSILRTSLADHEVATPLFKLLRHPNIEVQIAACGAVCNLVVTFSPMREKFTETGIVEVLCEQAHSSNAGLRLNAVWALHHLVDGASVDLKKLCLDQLEPGWLVQLIVDDTEDDALYSRNTSDRRLSAQDIDEEMEENMELDGFDEERRPWLWAGMWRSSTSRSTSNRSDSARMQEAERKLTALREAEINPVRKARSDDLAIQEQALNFIRNLITLTAPSTNDNNHEAHDTTEMIDYIFTEIGQDRLFEMLSAKLRLKVLHPFGGRRRSSTTQPDARVLYPQAKIIEAVAYILVHISASIPRHRQLVIAQTELLKTLGQQLNSRDKDVRVAVCQLITNLVWQDDSTDAQACAQRALELKRLGFLSKLESLEHEDGELDVRERAKSAVWQIKQTNL